MGISIEFASPDIFYALACFTYIIVGIHVASSDGATCAILTTNRQTSFILLAGK